ncbi:MAG TPA: sigma-70 family RNA polymerase sigma factor [Polyangiaceae bacterium]|nr:sigma-70 family RNA polymerase sigma factor [Polyangiaceae bacterium]
MQPTLRITRDLVRELGPRMVALARRTAHSREDAEDLVQEMWICALGAAPQFEGRSSVSTWLTTILRRRIADRYRRPRVSLPLDEERLDDGREDVFQLLSAQEQAEALKRLFPVLSALERDALRLCALEDLDRDQVCQRLGITRGHLRVILHRARRRLESQTT